MEGGIHLTGLCHSKLVKVRDVDGLVNVEYNCRKVISGNKKRFIMTTLGLTSQKFQSALTEGCEIRLIPRGKWIEAAVMTHPPLASRDLSFTLVILLMILPAAEKGYFFEMPPPPPPPHHERPDQLVLSCDPTIGHKLDSPLR